MYMLLLVLHSWLRWVALVAGVAATLAAFTERPPTGKAGRVDAWGLALMASLDLQMLIGLILYFVVSPNMQAIRANFGAAMKDPSLRFWAVEHLTAMLFAVVVVHVGRVLARKARTPDARRIRLLVCFALATVAMLLAIPWPGMANGRPLFRV